jgi:hypothetical protein
MRASHAVLLAALAAASLPAAVRADQIDKRLNDEMPDVSRHLHKKGYKNVGVLRFRVQVGKKTASFDNAPYNGNMPLRVENLLIMNSGDRETPDVGVIRNAGAAAAAAKIGDWFGNEKERKKLFDVHYLLAWDDKKVTADAFLTGLVSVSSDLKKTTLSLTCFDKDNLEPKEILTFTIATDREVVRDLGYSFVVDGKARASMVTKRSSADVDRNVLASVNDQAKPDNVAGIQMTILVDEKPVKIQAAKDEEGPRWQLECPPEDEALAVRLRNVTDKTLAVVLKLNGVSTLKQQTRSPDHCQKWIIRAGKAIVLKGFYTPAGDKLLMKPFKVLVGEKALEAKAQLGDRAGLMELDVFAEGAESDDDGLEYTAKGLPPSKEKEKEKLAKAHSYKAVRATLLKDAKLKTETTVAQKVVLVPDKEAIKAGKGKEVDFDSHSVGRLVVKVVPRQ